MSDEVEFKEELDVGDYADRVDVDDESAAPSGETAEKEPKFFGPKASDVFRFKTDIEYFASEGHVVFSQLSNAAKYGRFIAPMGILASAFFLGFAISGVGQFDPVKSTYAFLKSNVSYYLSSDPVEADGDNGAVEALAASTDTFEDSGRSWLGDLVHSGIGFDETTAILLPDGTRAHARFGFLTRFTDIRAGMPDAVASKKLLADYQASLVKTPSQNEVEKAKDEATAARLEASNEWDTTAWVLRYQLAVDGLTIAKPTEVETVSAQGFLQDDSNLKRMETTGAIAITDEPGSYFTAAYIGGVPAISYFGNYGCYTILGIMYDGCKPLSAMGAGDLNLLRNTLYGEPAPEMAIAEVEEVQEVEPSRPWYLDFPLVADSSVLTSDDFNALTKAVDQFAQTQGGSLHSAITSAVSLLPAAPMTVAAKGMFHNPKAIEAMKNGGVIATTDVPGQLAIAAYVDGKAQVRVRTQGGSCGVIFGETGTSCRSGDIAQVEEIPVMVKALYEQPDSGTAGIEPYFWFSAAPMVAESSLEMNDIITVFNAALTDVGNHSDKISDWTNTPKLDKPPLVARSAGFFAKPENVAALSSTGAVILPRDMERTFLFAVSFQGRLSLNVIEIGSRGSWDCKAIYGEIGTLIGECRAGDLTKYGDVLKSMFAATE
ncbi:hypothetical protein [Mesorhizobium sp. A623]